VNDLDFVKYSTDGRYLAIAPYLYLGHDLSSANSNISLWKVNIAKYIKSFEYAHSAGVKSLRFSLDGKYIYAIGRDLSGPSSFKKWDIRRGLMAKKYRIRQI
jgi:WD40 repeat protein